MYLLNSAHALDLASWWSNLDYKVESHEHYDFKNCQQFNQSNSKDYVVCKGRDDQMQVTELDDLSQQVGKIEYEVLQDDYLNRLKQFTKKELLAKKAQINSLSVCLSKTNPDSACLELRGQYLERIKVDLPRLRILMAQMNVPGKIYSPTEPERFERKLQHTRGETKVPDLSPDEAGFLKSHTKELELLFRDEVTAEVEIIKECQGKNPCPGKEPIVDTYVSKKFTEQNKRYQEAYNQMVSANPILSLLSLTGKESDEVMLKNVKDQLSLLSQSTQKSLDYINKLQGEDRKELMGLGLTVDNFLTDKADRIQCDLTQNLYDDYEWDETKRDIFLTAGTLVGAGACAFTAGIGCAVAVAVAGEGVNLALAESKLRKESNLYYAGQIEVSELQSTEQNRDLTLFLAPLSLVTFGGAKGVIGLKSVKTMTAKKTVQEERRINRGQRKLVEDLTSGLGSRRTDFLQVYNPGNKYQLTELDQTYMAGIAEILEKKAQQNGTKLSAQELRKKVQTELDELMRKCNGNK